MNRHACRRHLWLDNGSCVLCGASDQHRGCFSEWHVCAWYGPLEHDAPRKAKR